MATVFMPMIITMMMITATITVQAGIGEFGSAMKMTIGDTTEIGTGMATAAIGTVAAVMLMVAVATGTINLKEGKQ